MLRQEVEERVALQASMSRPELIFLLAAVNSCALLLATETAPWYQENAPGLIRTVGSCFFPVGLIMIVLSGSDLSTSDVMVCMIIWNVSDGG